MAGENEAGKIIAQAERLARNIAREYYDTFGRELKQELKEDIKSLTEKVDIILKEVPLIKDRTDRIGTIEQKIGMIDSRVCVLEKTSSTGEKNDRMFSSRSWAVIMILLGILASAVTSAFVSVFQK